MRNDGLGPDAAGTWIRREVALGHRRLAVIDLTGSAQPMVVSSQTLPRLALTLLDDGVG